MNILLWVVFSVLFAVILFLFCWVVELRQKLNKKEAERIKIASQAKQEKKAREDIVKSFQEMVEKCL